MLNRSCPNNNNSTREKKIIIIIIIKASVFRIHVVCDVIFVHAHAIQVLAMPSMAVDKSTLVLKINSNRQRRKMPVNDSNDADSDVRP